MFCYCSFFMLSYHFADKSGITILNNFCWSKLEHSKLLYLYFCHLLSKVTAARIMYNYINIQVDIQLKMNIISEGSCQFSIKNVKAIQIYDSRGIPTVQCQVSTAYGKFRASVPSGASTGKYEAVELRDNKKAINHGKSVYKAVQNVNTIIKQAIIGFDCRNQQQIDKLMFQKLDGSKNQYGWCKSKLGANAILSVSMAICRAAAAGLNIPLYSYIRQLYKGKSQKQQKFILPCPCFNVINGGKHGGNQLPIQQFMILPTGAKNFKEAMQFGTQTYQTLKKIIQKKHGIQAINVGDEGGFAPPIFNHIQALNLIQQAIKQANYQGKISIALDCASSQFYEQEQKVYNLSFKSKNKQKILKTNKQMLEMYKQVIQKYPVVSIQDGFDQDDWDGWSSLTNETDKKLQIVGDDLLVTNISRIKTAIQKKACNALLLKLNQIGTVTQALHAARLATQNNWNVMVSHRSGQTQDNFIAHLVVGLGVGQIKTGAPCRSQRLSKYNQLLRIEEELKDQSQYAGNSKFLK